VSLCYNFQKWTIISLASTAITLTIGLLLINFAHGQNLQNKGGFLLYNNTDFGFQLLYPRDWGVVEGDHKPGDFVTDIVTIEPLSEEGKHFTKKFVCGEVCLYIVVDNSGLGGTSLQQFSDSTYNKFKKAKGFDLLDYNSVSKLGNKKAFEIFFQLKQGNRDYTEKLIGTAFPPENADDSKSYLVLQFKTRDKFSEQTLPLIKTMIDSFRFIGNNTK
jgi:hypothetical protein